RKALGKDRRFRTLLARELSQTRLTRLPILQMNATRMTFPDDSFDCVVSYSAFEHIDEPLTALREVRRVLRPGGVAYISVHLYTCHSGSHDLAIMCGPPADPLWPHLRQEFLHMIHPSAYLNRLSMSDWHRAFAEAMPQTRFICERQDELAGPL